MARFRSVGGSRHWRRGLPTPLSSTQTCMRSSTAHSLANFFPLTPADMTLALRRPDAKAPADDRGLVASERHQEGQSPVSWPLIASLLTKASYTNNGKTIHGIESFLAASGPASQGYVANPSDSYAGLNADLGAYGDQTSTEQLIMVGEGGGDAPP